MSKNSRIAKTPTQSSLDVGSNVDEYAELHGDSIEPPEAVCQEARYLFYVQDPESHRADDGQRVIAVPRGDQEWPEADAQAKKWFWASRLTGVRAADADFIKNHANMWDGLGLRSSMDLTRKLLGLRTINTETAEAADTALFTVFNSSNGSQDLHIVLMALSAFVHSHPLLHHMADPRPVEPPFGSDTQYLIAQVLPDLQ